MLDAMQNALKLHYVGEFHYVSPYDGEAGVGCRRPRPDGSRDRGLAVDRRRANRPRALVGARHVQPEKSWGPPVDSAAQLRGICLLGLIRAGHPRQLEVLADSKFSAEFAREEAAAMIRWLVSKENSFATGAVFDLSGGRAVY